MKTIDKMLTAAAVIGVAATGTPAAAETIYSNVSGAVSIYDGTFGASHYDVPIFGQVFTAPGGNLLSWTFFNDSTATSGATFAVAAWNGSTVTGANLFSSGSNISVSDPDNPGYYSHTVLGINLALVAGQAYYAYFTTYHTTSPVAGLTFEGASTSPLGGAWTFSSSTNAPAGATYVTPSPTQSLVYRATFSTAAVAGVPEPATWAMMIAGFGMIGLCQRRRVKQTASVAYA